MFKSQQTLLQFFQRISINTAVSPASCRDQSLDSPQGSRRADRLLPLIAVVAAADVGYLNARPMVGGIEPFAMDKAIGKI